MPEPTFIIGAIAFAGCSLLSPSKRDDSAISDDARMVRREAQIVSSRVEDSRALFGRQADAIDNLIEVVREYNEMAADCEEYTSVNSVAFHRVVAILREFPADLPHPEFSVEPDGDITLDWMPGKVSCLSVIVGSTDRVAYAWSDGINRGHATERLNGGQLPQRICEEIERLYP